MVAVEEELTIHNNNPEDAANSQAVGCKEWSDAFKDKDSSVEATLLMGRSKVRAAIGPAFDHHIPLLATVIRQTKAISSVRHDKGHVVLDGKAREDCSGILNV
jgi:hypothetical protein